jgi:hypothetical protein
MMQVDEVALRKLAADAQALATAAKALLSADTPAPVVPPVTPPPVVVEPPVDPPPSSGLVLRAPFTSPFLKLPMDNLAPGSSLSQCFKSSPTDGAPDWEVMLWRTDVPPDLKPSQLGVGRFTLRDRNGSNAYLTACAEGSRVKFGSKIYKFSQLLRYHKSLRRFDARFLTPNGDDDLIEPVAFDGAYHNPFRGLTGIAIKYGFDRYEVYVYDARYDNPHQVVGGFAYKLKQTNDLRRPEEFSPPRKFTPWRSDWECGPDSPAFRPMLNGFPAEWDQVRLVETYLCNNSHPGGGRLMIVEGGQLMEDMPVDIDFDEVQDMLAMAMYHHETETAIPDPGAPAGSPEAAGGYFYQVARTNPQMREDHWMDEEPNSYTQELHPPEFSIIEEFPTFPNTSSIAEMGAP